MVTAGPQNSQWLLTCLYGSPRYQEKKELWESIAERSQNMQNPWMLIGDLNITINPQEKNSKVNKGQSSINKHIQDQLLQTDLLEVKFSGYPYTWSNHRQNDNLVEANLDRALANTRWHENFPTTTTYSLTAFGSDHTPILMNTNPADKNFKKPFRVYENWIQQDSCSAAYQTVTKLKITKKEIKKWNFEVFGNVHQHIKEVEKKIQEAQAIQGLSNNNTMENLKQELRHWYKMDSDMKYQNSRENLLKKESRNTKFFHSRANYRRRRNHIDSLKDDMGLWHSNKQEMEQLLNSHFSSITTSSNPQRDEEILSLINSCISE
ncbi:hypothetical protein MKW92_039943 [Papaver armeniacum]|nr:hypothetical protein MKW92_039943 [Papaver armeniacum]